ncbi:MAG: phosphonate C-P lyase system protein PhnG [Gemmataceae bacterium]
MNSHEKEGDWLNLRDKWITALMTHPKDKIIELGNRLGERYKAEHRKVPKAGLAMLRLRESVLGETFNLGEFPLSSAKVVLTASNSKTAEGGALVMVDDANLAVALAICDAVLAAQWEGAEEVAEFVRVGLGKLAEEESEREQVLASSKVNFALLNQEGEEDDE